MMDKKDVCIATITWARDEEEEKTLREALERLATLAIPVYITDGGSGTAFLDFLRSVPHFHLLPSNGRGLWAQAKNSLTAAYRSGAPFILYTEPDKGDFFRRSLPQLLAEIIVDERPGVVLAARSNAGFATFPTFQQMTETTINACCAEVIGKKFDYTYGPFLLNRHVVPHVEKMPEDTGWGWRPYAFILAHRLGYKIEAFEGDFFCPPAQWNDTAAERVYRMRQLEQNIRGIVMATGAVIDK